MKIPFLDDDFITTHAQSLLDDFGLSREPITGPPVPADDILELHLNFSLDFENLGKRFGLPGVDGFTKIATLEVFIDQRLDPVDHPEMEGRLNFTVAHEIGHIRLHEHWLRKDEFRRHTVSRNVCNLLDGLTPDEYNRIETQADKFAAELLMPRTMLRKSVESVYPFTIEPAVDEIVQMAKRSQSPTTERTCDLLHENLVEHFIGEMAWVFKASKPAMKRQLMSLGVIVKDDRSNLHIVYPDPFF